MHRQCALGRDLRAHRKALGLTQAELALKAGLVRRTVWLLEQGQGTVGSFFEALKALDLSLFYRNAAAESLPKVLLALRRRRHISQVELAEQVGVSHPTIRALEREGTGRLATLDR